MPINIGVKASEPKDETPKEQPEKETEQVKAEEQIGEGSLDLTNLGDISEQDEALSQPSEPPKTSGSNPVPQNQSGASFLMTGSQQQTAMEQVRAQQELRAKLRSDAMEFWLEPGQFAKVVFLDGDLESGKDHVFATPMVNTHLMQFGQSFSRIICNKHTEGNCVVCDGANEEPQALQLFTVINVQPYTIQRGKEKGKVVPARLMLFPATMKVRTRLLDKAKLHGGTLAGAYMQFKRNTKQDARTGDDMDYLEKVDLGAVMKRFPNLSRVRNQKGEFVNAPTAILDYAKCYPVVTNAELSMLRPDLAAMGGYSNGGAPISTGFGSDGSAEIDDELPF